MQDAAIINLHRAPEHAPLLAQWAYQEWYRGRDIDFPLVLKAYRERARNDGVPLTLVAIAEGAPVGMVTLKLDDLWSRRDLNPWLSSLYVVPARRCNGTGASLVRAVTEAARERGYPELFLFLGRRERDRLERFYARRGWTVFGDAMDNDGHETKVLRRDCAASGISPSGSVVP